jgi:predicted homoserine dehydrogenase-like protein
LIPIKVEADGMIGPGIAVENAKPTIVPVPVKDIRSQLLDLMEQNPSIVDELLEAAKGMDRPNIDSTVSNVTGGTVG